MSLGGRPDPDGLTSPAFALAKISGDDRDRTGNLRLAKPTLSQLSYVPGTHFVGNPKLEFRNSNDSQFAAIPFGFRASCFEFPLAPGQRNWARVDSDYRPHAYQACALTN